MFDINGRKIGQEHSPFIIAEVSANHNGELARAKQTIKAAKDNGAHAVKIQTYTPETMTLDSRRPDFLVQSGLWQGYSLYELYSEAHTPFEWHGELFAYAKELGITLFSTPFDETAVDLLESLGTPAYKVASFELVDLPLIAYIAKQKKPMLMSTGMASLEEMTEAIETARQAGCPSLLIFHCISSYPTPIEQSNLLQIPFLRREFGVEVGLSDHTLDHTAAIAATALGASAIEKHFTLNRQDKGPDSSFSLEPAELRELVHQTGAAFSALGQPITTRPEAEKDSTIFRRSLYFVRDLPKGAVIGSDDLRRIRPGFGLAPKHQNSLIGKKLAKDAARADAVTWAHIAKD